MNINNNKKKNLYSLNNKATSEMKNKDKNISPNKEKNINDINANKNILFNFNSNSNELGSNNENNNKNNKILINSELINLDSIDENSYNPDPFILPKKKFKHNFYISTIETTVYNYNKIKETVNKKLFNSKIPNKTDILQLKNFSLLSQLDQLNVILDTLVERKRFARKNNDSNSKKNKNIVSSKSQELQNIKLSSKDINIKLLNNFQKQYNLLTEKYKKISKEDYLQTLKSELETISKEISEIEKVNRDLKTTQFKAEYILKNKSVSPNDINYEKKLGEYNHLNNEYTRLMKKIPPKDEEIERNNEKIKQLNEMKNNLIKIAKEMYNINNPEEKIVTKKNGNINFENYKKKKELEKIFIEVNGSVKKYNYKRKENGKNIKQLEEDKITANNFLNDKTQLLEKLTKKFNDLELEFSTVNEQNYKKVNLANNIYNSDKKENKANNNKISSLENQSISPIKPLDMNTTEINDNKIVNMINDMKDNKNSTIEMDFNKEKNIENNSNSKSNNRYNGNNNKNDENKTLNNNQTYNKKMILEQLDLQKNQENLKMDKSINLKKNKLKPNFSFTLNDNIKDRKVNLSVAIPPKTTINKEEKNESEGEIKEDIQINNGVGEDKVNLSQNISMEKNDKGENQEVENEEGKKRENDLNTVPYGIEKEENKINNNTENFDNDEEQNYNFEQEQFFENEQLNEKEEESDDKLLHDILEYD